MPHPPTRNTLHVEQATLISQDEYPAEQYHLRLLAPKITALAKPGHFVHIQCDSQLNMRRPMSIMRRDLNNNTIDILYKVHGHGTALLAKQQADRIIDLIGPIGQSFKMQGYRKRPLLIGGGVGIPPMLFLAEHLKTIKQDLDPFVIMGSEIPFPFKPKPSQILMPTMPPAVTAAMPLLDDWGIPSRLTSHQDYAGCFNGYVTDLARYWLDQLGAQQHREVEIFCCGPTPMLKAVAQLAKEYDLPCQVSLEEYMACAVGGCAGCTVLIETATGPAMKRVCVDGPVFEANTVIAFQNT